MIAAEEKAAINSLKDEKERSKAETEADSKSNLGFLKRLVEKGKNWLADDKDLSDF